jgi:hypothetical protein
MAAAFGPALGFWQGCALTAWFICEGPMSRTDMDGLAHAHRKELAELERLGAPIAPALLEELIGAEAALGPAEPICEPPTTAGAVTIQISRGSRRKGFETLRDIITYHRRRWAEQYLTGYLRARWESEVREAARQHNLLLHEKGKVLIRQFVKIALKPTNHWFGGDISGLYRTIGEKAPLTPCRRCLIPEDRVSFVRLVARVLEGKLVNHVSLASESLWYLQLEEALGRPPDLKEFGVRRLGWLGQEITQDADEVWRIYAQAVAEAKRSFGLCLNDPGSRYR